MSELSRKSQSSHASKLQTKVTTKTKRTHVGDWDLIDTISSGSFGDIFTVVHAETGQQACAKLEKRDSSKASQLQIESATYRHLQTTIEPSCRKFFPQIHDFGVQGKYNYMIMTQMKCDLAYIIDKYSERQKLRCLISSIDALEVLHSAGILHRDIKPRNICIRPNHKCSVALIDLGLSKKYITTTGRHIPQQQKESIVGTYRYCSIPALLSLESSRRDDIESLVYTFINVFDATLPWQNLKILNLTSSDPRKRKFAEEQREKIILNLKQTTSPDTLCEDVPMCLQQILQDVKLLSFTEQPNYERYRSFVQQDLDES